MSEIKSVGIIGAGVIGASWAALFLSRGLQVLVSDPQPDADKKLAEHLKAFWPELEELGLAPGASLDNYRFVGKSLQRYYAHVDFIQEASIFLHQMRWIWVADSAPAPECARETRCQDAAHRGD